MRFILEKSDPKSFDINKRNNFDNTAEDIARHYGHKSVLDLYLRYTNPSIAQLPQLQTLLGYIRKYQGNQFQK